MLSINPFPTQVPSVPKDEVQKFEVVVKGREIHSKEVKKVLIKVVNLRTFIQTEKPIYNPGHTGKYVYI